MRFGHQACRVDTLRAIRERTRYLSTKISWLFDELPDNNASDNILALSAHLLASVAVKNVSEVIPTPGNDAILVVYKINACYNTYTRDGAFCHINNY